MNCRRIPAISAIPPASLEPSACAAPVPIVRRARRQSERRQATGNGSANAKVPRRHRGMMLGRTRIAINFPKDGSVRAAFQSRKTSPGGKVTRLTISRLCNEKARPSRPGFSSTQLEGETTSQAASSWMSSPSASLSASASALARRGDLARLCSMSFSASVSVMRFTEEISRTIRSRAAS